MSTQTVFLVGATGETGSSILDALLEDGSFNVTCFVRTASADKPASQKLRDRRLKVVTGDLTGPIEETIALLHGIDTVISTIFAYDAAEQIPVINAAVKAGVKRFVPCNFGTPSARGGILDIRDLKEQVHDHIFRQRLGFTIIDVGYWYEMSFPRVPSGKFDYAVVVPINDVYADGTAPNMLIARSDIGKVTARIIKDDRTLNKRVYVCGDVLSQNEIHDFIEGKTAEVLELGSRTAEDVHRSIREAREAAEGDPNDVPNKYKLAWNQYALTRYVRADNTPQNAEYLGYVDGRKLYPDFKYVRFAAFIDDLLAGKVQKVYPHLRLDI